MGTTSKVMFGYTVSVSSFNYLTITIDNMGGVFSNIWDLFSFYELANAFSKLSTTVLLCSEARLQEKVEESGVPPHFRDVSRTRLDRRVLVHLYLIRLKYFHELEF